MKNNKFKKITQKYAEIKDIKNKQVQDNWKKQFQMNQHEKLTAQNIQLQYKNQKNDFNMEVDQNPQYQQEDQNRDDRTKQQKQQQYYQAARQQKFIQFDGQQIYLGGLDIQLLKKQKEILKKQQELNNINKKITKFFQQKPTQIETLKNISKNKQYKTMVSNILNPPVEEFKKKCPLNQNTYYQFQTDYDFGSNIPKLVTKKLGKFHTNPIFPGITDQFITQLTEILKKQKNVQNKKQTEQKMILEDDSDDIFNEAPKINIEVGKKLEFGLKESVPQILQKRKREQIKTNEQQIEQFEKIQKKKKLLQQIDDDGYMQCYWNTGPSLQQIQQMKRQGIVITYGQKRQFKQKQKKINYNKQYEKIQRVIAEQENKKKK